MLHNSLKNFKQIKPLIQNQKLHEKLEIGITADLRKEKQLDFSLQN